MIRRLGLVLLLAALAPAGCATVAESRFGNPMTFTATDAETLELVARRILLELRFDIEYPEASEGRVATGPLTGASWFEFWREDTVGAYQRAESSLHTTRRQAVVSVSPREGGGSQVFVKVIKQRLSAPGHGPQNIGESFNLYDTDDTDLMRQNELAPDQLQWVDQGRDELLEQMILERIQASLR